MKNLNFLKNAAAPVTYVIILTAFFAAFCTACLFDSDPEEKDDDYLVQQVFSVDSLSILENANNTVSLRTVSGVPNPCYVFSHADINYENHDIYVDIFGKTGKEIVCIQVLGKLESDMKIKVDSPGTYNLHFIGEFQNLDTTIVIH